MRLSIETASYNQRRYGAPWIAKVDFSTNSKGDFSFGDFIGDSRNGDAGLLEIEVEPGDIVAQGQKDFRKPQNSAPGFAVIGMNGERIPLDGKADALQRSRMPLNQRIGVTEAPVAEVIASNPLAGFADSDLLAEIARRGLNQVPA